jgi:GTPase SAR1 family protein
MGKFGKKTVVSSDMSNYMIGVMGPSGFGKTTLMFKTCDKLFGEDGYMIFDIGAEQGTKAIDGVVYEHVPNFGKLKEVVDDIVKNKDSDYPDLKVVVLDTLDAYFEIVEEYVIKAWNSENAGNSNFKKATSINSVEGGYGRGMDRVVDTAKKVISRLNSVGVGVWWTAHVKEKDQADLYTGANFTTLTANMTLKYFNAIKNSCHIVACGYFDRNIEKQEVGDENPVTKKKKERSTIIQEARKIKFRDDLLIADAKSRFAHIVDEINLDTNEFITAIQNAIKAEQNGAEKKENVVREIERPKIVETANVEPVIEEEKVVVKAVTKVSDDLPDDEPPFDIDDSKEETGLNRETTISEIKALFKELNKDAKVRIKAIRGEGRSLEDCSDDELKEIKEIVDSELMIEE